jgi:hypothetical protein
VDHLTNGRFVFTESDDNSPAGPSSPTRNWTEEENRKVADGTHLLDEIFDRPTLVPQPLLSAGSWMARNRS